MRGVQNITFKAQIGLADEEIREAGGDLARTVQAAIGASGAVVIQIEEG